MKNLKRIVLLHCFPNWSLLRSKCILADLFARSEIFFVPWSEFVLYRRSSEKQQIFHKADGEPRNLNTVGIHLLLMSACHKFHVIGSASGCQCEIHQLYPHTYLLLHAETLECNFCNFLLMHYMSEGSLQHSHPCTAWGLGMWLVWSLYINCYRNSGRIFAGEYLRNHMFISF